MGGSDIVATGTRNIDSDYNQNRDGVFSRIDTSNTTLTCKSLSR